MSREDKRKRSFDANFIHKIGLAVGKDRHFTVGIYTDANHKKLSREKSHEAKATTTIMATAVERGKTSIFMK